MSNTIDMTPKWADIVLVLAVAASNGSPDAQAELLRLARIADEANERAKNK
jgi:hypothetical protein